jgi:WD40 repeat protein
LRGTVENQEGGSRLNSFVFSADGKTLITGGSDGIEFWDANTLKSYASLSIPSVDTLAMSEDSKSLATVSRRHEELRLWELSRKKEFINRCIIATGIYCVAFSSNNKLLVIGDMNGHLRLWEVATGRERLCLKGHQGPIHAVAFHRDGQLVASAGEDTTVRLWDIQSGKEVATLKGHKGPVSSVAFSPDGITLASGSWDTTILVWDVSRIRKIKR